MHLLTAHRSCSQRDRSHCRQSYRGRGRRRHIIWSLHHRGIFRASRQAAHLPRLDGRVLRHCLCDRSTDRWRFYDKRHLALVVRLLLGNANVSLTFADYRQFLRQLTYWRRSSGHHPAHIPDAEESPTYPGQSRGKAHAAESHKCRAYHGSSCVLSFGLAMGRPEQAMERLHGHRRSRRLCADTSTLRRLRTVHGQPSSASAALIQSSRGCRSMPIRVLVGANLLKSGLQRV